MAPVIGCTRTAQRARCSVRSTTHDTSTRSVSCDRPPAGRSSDPSSTLLTAGSAAARCSAIHAASGTCSFVGGPSSTDRILDGGHERSGEAVEVLRGGAVQQELVGTRVDVLVEAPARAGRCATDRRRRRQPTAASYGSARPARSRGSALSAERSPSAAGAGWARYRARASADQPLAARPAGHRARAAASSPRHTRPPARPRCRVGRPVGCHHHRGDAAQQCRITMHGRRGIAYDGDRVPHAVGREERVQQHAVEHTSGEHRERLGPNGGEEERSGRDVGPLPRAAARGSRPRGRGTTRCRRARAGAARRRCRPATNVGGQPYWRHLHAADRPSPSRKRPPVSDCRVWPIEASTIGWRSPGWVTAAPTATRSVTWPIAPASDGRSLVSYRSPIHTAPNPSCSAARACSSPAAGP